MDHVERELYDVATEALSSLALEKDYPINPTVVKMCFLEGFDGSRFNVIYNNGEFLFCGTPRPSQDLYELSFSISTEEILRKKGIRPKNTSSSALESVAAVYDNAYLEIDDSFSEELASDYLGVRSRFIDRMQYYFSLHQENLILPSSGEIPNLKSPLRLFYEVVNEFPIGDLENAMTRNRISGISAKKLAREGWDLGCEFGKNKPSLKGFFDLFRASYLLRLAKLKGYSNPDGQEITLLQCVEEEFEAFREGSKMTWETPNPLKRITQKD